MRPGPHVGRGSGDGSRHAEAAEQRRPDIGAALRNQLAVGAVTSPRHAVGNDRREQGFDRAEQGEGERRGQHGHDLVHG